MTRLTRALRHRNYRLFFGGQSISLVGTWITRVATSWLVFRLTGSELSLLLLPVVGAGFMVQMAGTNTVLQTLVEDRLRGRVMAFYTMAFFGTAPIGSLLAGVAADRSGSQWTIALCGVVAILSGLWLASRLPALRAAVHPIYRERGIMPVPAVDTGAKTL